MNTLNQHIDFLMTLQPFIGNKPMDMMSNVVINNHYKLNIVDMTIQSNVRYKGVPVTLPFDKEVILEFLANDGFIFEACEPSELDVPAQDGRAQLYAVARLRNTSIVLTNNPVWAYDLKLGRFILSTFFKPELIQTFKEDYKAKQAAADAQDETIFKLPEVMAAPGKKRAIVLVARDRKTVLAEYPSVKDATAANDYNPIYESLKRGLPFEKGYFKYKDEFESAQKINTHN